MEFNIENYKGKYAMHCKAREEAKSFCNYLHSLGKHQANTYSYKNFTYQETYKEDTCYSFNDNTYAAYKYYSNQYNYTILEWEDFMAHTFTKLDLKSGDILTSRNGERGIYIKEHDTIIYIGNEAEEGYMRLANHNSKTLKDQGCSEWDIVKIQRAFTAPGLVPSNWNELEVIWEEKAPIEEMTLEEVCKALGKEIKIVKSK